MSSRHALQLLRLKAHAWRAHRNGLTHQGHRRWLRLERIRQTLFQKYSLIENSSEHPIQLWNRLIEKAAVEIGWRLETYEIQVPTKNAQALLEELEALLWPEGVLLQVISVGFNEQGWQATLRLAVSERLGTRRLNQLKTLCA